MLLTSLAKQASTLGVGLRRAHHRVDGIQLADVLQAVDAFVHLLLPSVPGIIAGAIFHLREDIHPDVLLIEHELHQHAILRILIEYHLEIGSHRNHAIHLFHFISQNHQISLFTCSCRRNIYIEEKRQETVKGCIMTKAKRSR